jgi:hypothetical protein
MEVSTLTGTHLVLMLEDSQEAIPVARLAESQVISDFRYSKNRQAEAMEV